VLFVAAPIHHQQEIIGAVSIGKPAQSLGQFVEAARHKTLMVGLTSAASVIVLALMLSMWLLTSPFGMLADLLRHVRTQRSFDGSRLFRRAMRGLGTAYADMRDTLAGHNYVADYVQTLTHEVKSPLSAIRGAAELLQEPMPDADRARFASNIAQETQRIQELIDRMMELTVLESRHHLRAPTPTAAAEKAVPVRTELISALGERQQRMLAQISNKSSFVTASASEDMPWRNPQLTDGKDVNQSARELQRREAEISRRIEDENKRPKKTFISPSTREAGYAVYFDQVRQRIEKIGTLNFPQKDGKKLYGELTMSISIFQDGQIYKKDRDGGISIDRSSGNPALDEAARRIVMRAAPFSAFSKNMRSTDRDDVWVMTTRFRFTRDDGLEAQMQGSLQ
jgi:signal transduction histidine kinase